MKAQRWDNLSPCESSNKPNPPLQESNVAILFNLAAGPVENAPDHKALEAKQGSGYRSILDEILFARVLCRPDIGYAVTTLAKFSTAPNALHYKSLKHLAIYLHQTQDLGIMHWRSEPVDSLPEVSCDPMKFDDSLPVIPPPSHLRQLITHVDAAHANKLRQRHFTSLQRGTVVAWPVVLWLIALARNPSVRRVPRKRNLLQEMLQQKLPNICVSFFMNWGTLRLSPVPSTKITTQ